MEPRREQRHGIAVARRRLCPTRSTTTVDDDRHRASAEATATTRHFMLAVLALAMGGFAIGTTEFVTMGLLPEIAAGVGVSIPTAGHVISAYAVGVVIGAPVLAFLGAGLPRRGLLVALMVAYAVGNAASALAASYGWLLVARVATGFPHGAFFGVASLVAASLAPEGRKGRAVAMVMLGLSVANVVGVPAATWLGQHLGWRAAYWLAAGLALLTAALVVTFVPSLPGDGDASGRRELRAFREPQVWLTLLRGRGRLRRHVRRLLLRRPDRDRGRRPAGRCGAGVPPGVRARHGRRHLARRRAGRLVGLPVAAGLLARHGRGAAPVRGRRAVRAGGCCPSASW